EMIHAGRERRDPFELLGARQEIVIDRDPERDQHVDGREIDRDVGRGRGLVDGDAGELPRQLARIGVGEFFQDQDMCRHDSPNSRVALLKQMSARTWSESATVSAKWPASSADSNG